MNAVTRTLLWLIAGVILFLTPWFVRAMVLNYDDRAYMPPDVPAASMAATPVPTPAPAAADLATAVAEGEFRAGPVVVDLAHLNRLNRSSFQPLAAALAARNVGLRFWLPKSELNTFDLQNFLDFPDQSDQLAEQLADASALVALTPFFLWSPQEIQRIEQFVADGGRLLLISDPDVVGDVARDINNLAEPFGAVFNEDYLYDTVDNDGNHTHVFLNDFGDQAADLTDSRIAMYGARSIGGAVAPQAAGAATTLSSLRPGTSGFTTVALAGTEARGTQGRVLVMSDFDVLTTPYADRHDNRRLLEFVADFLVDVAFEPTVVDFPAYLGKEVKLLYGSEQALGADLLAEGARLQERLSATGRVMTLADKDELNGALGVAGGETADLIYLADFSTAESDAELLTELGLVLVEEVAEPVEDAAAADLAETASAGATGTATETVAVTATVTPTETTAEAAEAENGEANAESPSERTPVPTFTLTPTATSMPTPTPTPQVTTYLETQAGLRFLADETLFVGLSEMDGDGALLSVLAADEAGITAGVERLLARDFQDCIREETRVLCPLRRDEAEESAATPTAAPTAVTTPGATPAATPSPDATPAPSGDDGQVLIIDDNDGAEDGEVSEADAYIKLLTGADITPDLWQTAVQGTPTLDDLQPYRWVIWSGAGYRISGPGVQDLALLFEYTNAGGRLTISSRQPNLGQASGDPAPIRDLTVDAEGQELIRDFPTDTIALDDDLPPVQALSATFVDTVDIKVALRRGPESEYDDAPALLYYSDEEAPEPQGARIVIQGMALGWLPDDLQETLIRNMAAWMLED